MKITTITVEANAEELRQCNTVAEGMLNLLRRCFSGGFYAAPGDEDDAGEDDGEEEEGCDGSREGCAGGRSGS